MIQSMIIKEKVIIEEREKLNIDAAQWKAYNA